MFFYPLVYRIQVVSISAFSSILRRFLHKGAYYSIFSCFPSYSSDIIVSQKKVHMTSNLTFQWVVACLIDGPILTFYTAEHQKVFSIEWLRWLIFQLVHFMQYKPRKSKTDALPKTFQNTRVKFSLNKRFHFFETVVTATLTKQDTCCHYINSSRFSCIQTMHSNQYFIADFILYDNTKTHGCEKFGI